MHGPLDPDHALGRLEGSFGPLVPGRTYLVDRDFTDFDGDVHRRGECWQYLGYTGLPSGDGFSLFVKVQGRGVFVIRLLDDPAYQQEVLALPAACFRQL